MIKIDLPMPDGCDECPFNFDYCWCRGVEKGDNRNNEWPSDFDFTTRPGWCPMKEQPEIIRCKECQHWKPPHVELTDGRQRSYKDGDKNDPFGIGVSLDVGINIGGRCWLEYNRGYGRDMRVWRGEKDYCSRAEKLPDGMTSEEWWGLSEEPADLTPD